MLFGPVNLICNAFIYSTKPKSCNIKKKLKKKWDSEMNQVYWEEQKKKKKNSQLKKLK